MSACPWGDGLAATDAPRFGDVDLSGTLNGQFGLDEGRLPYRTQNFERFEGNGGVQDGTVMNCTGAAVPHTLITEHEHFAPWGSPEHSVC